MNGDGCSDVCEVEGGWNCPEVGECSNLPPCGNGILQRELGEECDDGNNENGDNCSSTCHNETQYCGNGRYEPNEMELCDDGNQIDEDGCSNSCLINSDHYCYYNEEGFQSACELVGYCSGWALCGNGCVEYGEQCDDG